MKAAINRTLLKDLPKGRSVDIRDTRLQGFVLRVRPSGTATYRVQYGRGKWFTIGRADHLTPAQAREQAQAILGEVARGGDPAQAKKRSKAATFRDYLAQTYGPWLKANRKDGQATWDRLARNFDRELGGKPLPDITPWLVDKWRSKRIKAGRATTTVNRDMGALKAALNRAVDWDIIEANPIAKVRPYKTDKKGRVRYLSSEEEKRLRDALKARESRLRDERKSANEWREKRGYPAMPDLEGRPFVDHVRPLVLLALNTGLRRGELFGLKWNDIDMGSGVLTVGGGGAKSGQTRHVPLNDEARTVLKQWRECVGKSSGLVFPGRGGRRLDNIRKAFQGIVSAAEIDNFRFHDLRHTFASNLVMAGVSLYVVKELLGHSTIQMTERYAHLNPNEKQNAVAKLAGTEERGHE